MVDHAFEASTIAFSSEPTSSSKFNHIILSIIGGETKDTGGTKGSRQRNFDVIIFLRHCNLCRLILPATDDALSISKNCGGTNPLLSCERKTDFFIAKDVSKLTCNC